MTTEIIPAHSPWGPSGSDRRIRCAGSLAAEAQYKDTDNVHAVIGSGAHALAELILTQFDVYEIQLEAEDWIGEQMFVPMSDGLEEPVEFDNEQVESVFTFEADERGPGYLVKVDDEMAHNVNGYVGRVKAYAMDKDFKNAYFAVEEKLDLSKWLPDTSGTADAAALVGTEIKVRDLKYGKGVKVFAKGNTQGRCYALGILALVQHLHKIETVEITIDQPRLDHIDSETLTVTELLDWANKVLAPAYKESMKPDAARTPGTKQCRFCLHKQNCKELADEVDFGIKDSFPILDKEAELSDHIVPLQLAELAKIWYKAVEAYAIERLEANVPVCDESGEKYKLVYGRGSRYFTDTTTAMKTLRMNKVYSKDFMTNPVLKSVAQVEKTVGKKQFNTIYSHLVVKKEGKITLAPMSDKRDAIGSAKALGFEDVS